MFLTYADLISWLLRYRYHVIFPLMIVEGPATTVGASFLASLGYFNIFIIFLLAILGDMVGDSIYYVVGRWAGLPLIERWGKHFGFTEERVTYMQTQFNKHNTKTLIIGKFTQFMGTWVLLGAGAAKVPFWPFLWINFLGTVPKAILFVVVGYFFGNAYAQLSQYSSYASIVALAVILVAGLSYYVYRKSKRAPRV